MPFTYQRTVHFQDTDAAGVVYFANVLTMCHEAYEASLAMAGIDLKEFFAGKQGAIPIVHAEVDFFRPMFCGDRLEIQLVPERLTESEFEVSYEIFLENQVDRVISKAKTRHVCIDPATRTRQAIAAQVVDWLHQWTIATQ